MNRTETAWQSSRHLLTPGWDYLDITKIIEDGLGNRDTTLDFSSKLLGITYGLYTDKNCTRPVSGLDNIGP